MERDDTNDGDRKRIKIKYLGYNTRRRIERRKNKALKRRSDIEQQAFDELKAMKQEYDRLSQRYRPIGFTSLEQAFEYLVNLYEDYMTCKDDLTGLEISIIEQLQHSASWLLRGLNQQESLLNAYIKKHRDLEAIHNVKLRYVDHAIYLYYKVVGDKLWLQANSKDL